MRTTVTTVLAAALAGGLLLGSAGAASAAHCTGGDAPGFSWFGTVHAQAGTDPEGGNPGPHMGTSGASNCLETTGNPSERAPGRR